MDISVQDKLLAEQPELPLYVETKVIGFISVAVLGTSIAAVSRCAMVGTELCPQNFMSDTLHQLAQTFCMVVVLASICCHMQALKPFEEHLHGMLNAYMPQISRYPDVVLSLSPSHVVEQLRSKRSRCGVIFWFLGFRNVNRLADFHSIYLSRILLLMSLSIGIIFFCIELSEQNVGLDVWMVASRQAARPFDMAGQLIWSIAMIVPYLLSLHAVEAYLKHLQSLGEVPDWMDELRAVHSMDVALESVWRSPCAVPWAMTFVSKALETFEMGVQFLYALSHEDGGSPPLEVQGMCMSVACCLFYLYLLTLVSSRCVSKNASGKSILGAARAFGIHRQKTDGEPIAFQLDMDDSQRLKYLHFMKYVQNNNMGIELFGVFVDFGLAWGLLVKAASILPVAYGFAKAVSGDTQLGKNDTANISNGSL